MDRRKAEESIVVDQGWFYAEHEKSVGPVSIDVLVAALRRLRDPGEAVVWRSGFDNWRAAKDIPELAGRLLTPRPVPIIPVPDPRSDRFTSDRFTSDAGEAGAADGFLPDQTTGRWRGRLVVAITGLVALALIAVLGVEYASRTGNGSTARESQAAIATVGPAAEQPKASANSSQPDAFPRMIADAYQVAIATDSLVRKLWSSIEPPALQTQINFATATRRELEAYRLGAVMAEENAKTALDQYIALLKAERETLEELARSAGVTESARQQFLRGVDERHAAATELNRRMLSGRVDFYRAIGNQQKVMIEQSGKYKVLATGQFRFSNDAALKKFDAALADVTAASKQLDLLEDEVMKLRDSEQQQWKELAAGSAAATGQQ